MEIGSAMNWLHKADRKDTKTDRLIDPGEKIEMQMSHDGHALSIKPVH